MMARAVAEWIGRTPDSAIPDRVKDRVSQRVNDNCQRCVRRIGGKLQARFDHVIPLILGGENRETNLQLLCDECHAAKTRLDVKLKAKVARVRKRRLGIVAPRKGRPMPGSRASGLRKRMDGTVERRS